MRAAAKDDTASVALSAELGWSVSTSIFPPYAIRRSDYGAGQRNFDPSGRWFRETPFTCPTRKKLLIG